MKHFAGTIHTPSWGKRHHFSRTISVLIGLLMTCVCHVWADNAWYVVGCAISPADNFNQVWLNVARCGNCYYNGQGEWTNPQMSKAGVTFEGKDLYVTHYEDYHSGLNTLAFQLKKDGTFVTEIKNIDNEWKATSENNFWHKRIIDYNTGTTGNWYDWKTMSNGAKVYFDASGWSQTEIKLVTAHANHQKYYTLTNITGTKLYYGTNTDSWSDAMGWGVVGGSSRSGGNDQWISDISSNAPEYTGLKNWDLNGTGAANAYLCVNKGKSGEQPNMYYFADYTGQDNTSTLQLNNTQTFYTVVKAAGGSYISANSKATISISSYELTGQGTTTQRTPSISTSESSTTVSACRTATTRLQVGAVADGYRFEGWYTAATGGELVSNLTDYIYYPTEAKTLYARFSEITYTVSFANDDNGSTSPSRSQEVGVITGVAISATPNTGYQFDTWTSSNGGDFTSDAATASNTFKPTANTTLTASFTPKTYDNGIIDKTTGTADGSYSVTFGETSLTPSAPTKAGYHVEGYYLEYDAEKDKCDNQIAEPDGTLKLNKASHTNASGKWIYDGAPTIYANWEGNSHTLQLYKNDGTDGYTSTSVTVGSNTYTISAPTRTGYDFAGFYTAPSEGTKVININLSKEVGTYFDASSNWLYDNDVSLYAHWTPVALTFSTAGSWSTESNWSPACVPTSEHDVTISADATVSGAAAAKSVTISGGSLTIDPTGALEVAGAITNTDASKLIINSDASNQGALLFNSAGTTQATVNIYSKVSSTSAFQFIAVPVSVIGVQNSFAGAGIYTYVWNEGSGWERRSYYDDLSAFEAVGLTQTSLHDFSISGALISTSDAAHTLAYTSGDCVGMNMLGNSWTAPVKIAEMSITGNAESTVYVYEDGNWVGYPTATAGTAVVPALQAYTVLATSGGGSLSISYDDAVRGNATNRTAALRAPSRNTAEEMMQIGLTVSDGERQTSLRLYEDALFTDDFDNGWEARYIEGDGLSGQLVAQTDDKMTVLASPNLEGTVLGFIPGQAANYVISFSGDGEGYFLNDRIAEQSVRIAEGNTYTFTPDESNDAARFVISRTPIHSIPTSIDTVHEGTRARKQVINGVLYIIRDGRLYHATGALVK